jgi:iron complex outermembrane receptor protein
MKTRARGAGKRFFMVLATLCVRATLAQTSAGADAPALEEIVVSAQRRSENLQNVPITVSAVTAAALAANKVESTQDLQFLVPSLVYNSASGFAQPFLRGIGSDFTVPNADPSVATYIDGAFVADQVATIQGLLAVDRVEVLEGPQGTLYGRNAVGGAISLYTITPTQKTDAEAMIGFGNFARKELSAHLSGGLSSDLAVGVYVASTEMNSYTEDIAARPAGSATDESAYSLRVKAVYTPTDRLTLTGSVEGTHSHSFDQDTYREISPNALVFQLFPNAPRGGAPYTTNTFFPSYNIVSQESATLREEYELGWARVVGISNYRNLRNFGGVDISGSSEPILGADQIPLTSRQASQELQLVSPQGNTIRWIGGLFYFHETAAYNPVSEVSQILFGPEYLSLNTVGVVTTKSYAAFGQADFPLSFLTDGLQLTIGGRLTKDEKFYLGSSSVSEANGDLVGTPESYPASSHSWSEFTPKVTVDYTIGDSMIYATFSEGFKSGVYNISTPTSVGPVNPEKLKAYEVGEKSRFWNDRVQLNSSAYYYDYRDLQVQLIDFANAGATVLENAATAKAYGLESSLAWAVSGDLTLTAQGAWEHSEYTKFDNFAAVDPLTLAAVNVNATGNQLQRAPEWIGSTGAAYNKALAGAGTLHANANLYWNGGFYWTAANTFRQSPYALVNTSLGYTLPGDQWTVTAWGKNLTNRLYESGFVTAAALGVFAHDAPPRMFGLSIDYKFR